ncbi:hypothetical protein O9X90_07650 [Agrobacterium leguminum]|uniref:hypothetical protein n=1 Tax=Agrobacterium leguminum TaxID=2792015 RepID=UPI0022B836A6|nr:hypothetical protein [Agrobacterium leguminum]MCZ7932183.1 hypothetical protein [Agrobacterium leguminum]
MTNRKIRAELEIEGKDKTSPAIRSVATRMGQIERQMSRFNKTAAGFEKPYLRFLGDYRRDNPGSSFGSYQN